MNFDPSTHFQEPVQRPDEESRSCANDQCEAAPSRRGFLSRSSIVFASGLVLGHAAEGQAGGKLNPKIDGDKKKAKKKSNQIGPSYPAPGGASGAAGSGNAANSETALVANAKKSQLPTLFKGTTTNNFLEILTDENAHVAFLLAGLGSMARPKPTFQNLTASSISQFTMMAMTFENLGVQAYIGAAIYIQDAGYLSSAARIATIEARHASFLNNLMNEPLAPGATPFDSPLLSDAVVADAMPYIQSLNGGTVPGYIAGVRSPDNDIAILNFALALEFLEQEFYRINVPKFFG